MTQPLRGVIAPNLTPFQPSGEIAHDLYVGHVKRLLDQGCVGVAPFGTTGEALSAGVGERIVMLETLVSEGVDPARMIPGTGVTNIADSARLTRRAVELGCAGAMVLPPFYFKDVPDDGLFAYFARPIDAVGHDDLRIYLYHIPQVSGVGIPVEVVARLREAFPDQVVGIKDSSGDWENTRRLLTEVDGLIVYPGSELPLLDALELDAPGCISATANINAATIAAVIKAWDEGRHDEAQALHEKARSLRLTVQGYAPIPAQKRLLALWSGDERWAAVQPPLLPMSDERGRELADTLAKEHALAEAVSA